MKKSLLERAKELVTPGRAAVLAIVPLATVAARSARATPAITFTLSNASINGVSVGNFNNSNNSDGSITTSGSSSISQGSAFSGSGGGFSGGGSSGGGSSGGSAPSAVLLQPLALIKFGPDTNSGGTVTLDLNGSETVNGPVGDSDVVFALMSIQAQSSSSTPITYEGAMLTGDYGEVDDFASPPSAMGTSIGVSDLLSLPAEDFQSYWDLQMSFYWPDSNPDDTISISLPVTLGEDIPVPEPASAAGLLAISAPALLRRRRRRPEG